MKNKGVKKISLVVLLGLTAALWVIPLINAETITLDGEISETVWLEWFEDPGFPSYSTHYTLDDDAIYIGIILDIDNIEDANLRFAFRAENIDYKIKITPEGDISFNPGTPSITSWWGSRRPGLPQGVEVVKSETNGLPSYEIKISKEILGDYTEIPDNFPFWVLIRESNKVLLNTYPDSRADWWFYISDSDEIIGAEKTPMFHAPEFPLGTVSSIAVMAAALVLANRKNNNIHIR
jgi:hypothetical protein